MWEKCGLPKAACVTLQSVNWLLLMMDPPDSPHNDQMIEHVLGVLSYLKGELNARKAYYDNLKKNFKPGDELKCVAPLFFNIAPEEKECDNEERLRGKRNRLVNLIPPDNEIVDMQNDYARLVENLNFIRLELENFQLLNHDGEGILISTLKAEYSRIESDLLEIKNRLNRIAHGKIPIIPDDVINSSK